MKGILNETTNTVHKHRAGASALQAECGATDHLERGYLRSVAVERVLTGADADKCGRCFAEAGGY